MILFKQTFLLALLATIITSCSLITGNKNGKNKGSEDTGNTVNFSYMDNSIKPKDDFYNFANGSWTKDNPVPSSETSWSSFNVLQKENYIKLRTILEELSEEVQEPGSIGQILGDYYYSFMDKAGREKEGSDGIEQLKRTVKEMKSFEDLPRVLATLHNYGIDAFFSAGVEQDLKDNSRNVLYLGQGGLGLPSKAYYLKEDKASRDIQFEYRTYIERLSGVFGSRNTSPEGIFNLEKSLAEVSMSRVELRNYVAQYNPMSINQLAETTGQFHWDTYFTNRNISSIDSVIVAQPDFINNIANLYDMPLNDIKSYLRCKIIIGTDGILGSEFESTQFDFYGTILRGQKEQKPDWKRGIDAISRSAISEALGHAFVNRYFSQSSKQKVNEMVDNIISVYASRIENLAWMSSETKLEAKKKLNSFNRKLGFPDKWTDFSTIEITKNSYATNVLEVRKFKINKNIQKLNSPIDKSEWAMAPHIVNAYYNPLFNEIVFPAGIMQPPFFDPTKEDAVNYATMGAVIGHELTHGFDDQGAQFNSEGEFVNWWSEQDQLQFSARTKKLVNQFNNYEALPGMKINGQLTLGENIADLGGLTISYYAYQKSMIDKKPEIINGYTNNQRFFIAFAQVWKSNYTDDAMKVQINTNNHSPGKWRVLGTLSNMPEFFAAFDIKEGDAMRQAKEKIAVIW